jgi:hypothetical protein
MQGKWQAGAAGFMIGVTLVEIAPKLMHTLSIGTALICAFVGGLGFVLLQVREKRRRTGRVRKR